MPPLHVLSTFPSWRLESGELKRIMTPRTHSSVKHELILHSLIKQLLGSFTYSVTALFCAIASYFSELVAELLSLLLD